MDRGRGRRISGAFTPLRPRHRAGPRQHRCRDRTAPRSGGVDISAADARHGGIGRGTEVGVRACAARPTFTFASELAQAPRSAANQQELEKLSTTTRTVPSGVTVTWKRLVTT